MTGFGYDPNDDLPPLPPAIVEGSGTANPLPRVTVRLTSRQLALLATQCEFMAGTDEREAHEYEAMGNAFGAILNNEALQTDACVCDCAYAPEVHPKW